MYEEQKAIAAEITGLRNLGMMEDAIGMCQKAARQFPNDSFFPKLLGDMYRQGGRFEEAAEEYLKILQLIQPSQFQIFVKAYHKLEQNAPEHFMRWFRDRIMMVLEAEELPEELRKRMNFLLGSEFPLDKNFLNTAEQANDDRNRAAVQREIEKWESIQDISRIEALATHKINQTRESNSRGIDTFLIQRLEKLGRYDLALSLIEKTKKPYTEKMIIVAILRMCRKKADYTFAERVLQIDEKFIESSDFNIQYELVYYFQTANRGEELEKTLRLMRDTSATRSIPIARTLYNFYLSLSKFEEAQSIYEHIRNLEQNQKNEYGQHKKHGTKSRSEVQLESEQFVWQRMKDLVSDQEHNRQMIALRDLLKGFSHELGQPITNIRYAIQLHQRKIKRGKDAPEDLETLLSDILVQTDRLGVLLARFSPVVSPKNEAGTFSVRDCVSRVFGDLETRLHGQNITYRIDGSPEISLQGDQVQFSQVFYNLVLNSMQAVEKDGRIDIGISAPAHNMVTIEFADNGPGIPEEYYQKIFEPFFSTKDPTSGNGGEGLGLYIVWNILKMFNGTIQIDKNFRGGTRFLIQIQQTKGGTQV